MIFGGLFILTGYLGKLIDFTDDKKFVIATGYQTLLLGLVTITLHNIWVADWRVAITILGWVTLLKGITKIAFPEHIHKQSQRFKSNQWLSAVAMMLFGAWLLFMSLNT